MKSPFLIDLCIISDKSLSSSYPPYLGYFLSPLVPHCPLTTSGHDASTSNCFPKDAPSTCLLPIVHLLVQQFHILPSVNIWDCARHMSAFLQCAFISHSLTTVTLFPRIIRIRVHQLWNVHILPRMFSALFSSHSSTALRSHTVRLFLPFAELASKPPGDSVQGTKCDLAPWYFHVRDIWHVTNATQTWYFHVKTWLRVKRDSRLDIFTPRKSMSAP